MEDQILKLLRRKNYAPMNVPELLRALMAQPNEQQTLQAALNKLVRKGQIARIKGNRFIIPTEADLIPGRLQITRQGNGYLQPDDSSMKEIPVAANETSTALHDDRVLVRRDSRIRFQRGREVSSVSGTVIRILERARSQIVGTLKQSPQFLYVIPDDPRLQHDIYVPQPKDLGRPARAGDKVVVELREWESRHTNPEGEIVEILGAPDEEGVDLLCVLRAYNLPLSFPRKVLQEAKQIGNQVTDADRAGRTDCRAHRVITIDPVDAKDFDDAFYIERDPAGHWKLWVHIADVSHYVKPGTELDIEARRRGNSTYLVDRVIPMLPEALSNELCSLKPNVDRLSKCVEFAIDDRGEVLRSKCYSAVIHSQRRYSYEEAFEVLERKPKDDIERMLHDAHKIAQKIRKIRFHRGSLNLDFPETKIRLDEKGDVLRIEQSNNDVSHQLIEEFMLLANEAVAGTLIKQRRGAIHRVHEQPDERRLMEYRDEVLSHDIPCGNLRKTSEVQKLLNRLDKMVIGPALKIGFLKSLMRARYSTASLGHYGLAKAKYAHFTSPIRRYADLVVHRSLFEKKAGGEGALREIAEHISRTERNSSDAERDSKTVKLYAFLEKQIATGEFHTYSGLVTDLRNFGFFVDVSALGMSGLVPLSALDDDFYVFDARARRVTGRRNRRSIQLGDRIEVQILKIDRFKKQVDFRLLPEPRGGRSNRGGAKANSGAGKSRPDRRGGRVAEPRREARPAKPKSKSEPKPQSPTAAKAPKSRRHRGESPNPGSSGERGRRRR